MSGDSPLNTLTVILILVITQLLLDKDYLILKERMGNDKIHMFCTVTRTSTSIFLCCNYSSIFKCVF